MTISEVPLISVCVPVFNGEKYIRENIDSVLRQTEKNFELIVVDNCSTDHTLEIVATYSDSRINLFKSTSNIGSIRNFNRCIELSRGEYFVLLPHDDFLLPTALKTFSEPLIADLQIGLAYSSYYIINENGKKTRFRMVAPEDKIMSSEEAIKECIIHGSPIQCAMARTKLFSYLGSFDKNAAIWSDVDLWCRIFFDGNKAAYFKTPQNCVRVHPEQGQRAFMNRDKHSIRIFSDHMGYTRNPTLIKNNTYHSLTFKHVQTLFNRIPISSDLHKLRPLSAKWILGPLIKDLIISLILGNWKNIKQDMDLLFKIVRWAGVFRMIPILLGIPLELIKRLRKRLLKQNIRITR